MSVIERATELLAKMSAAEKAWLYRKITGMSAGTLPGIEKTPGVCGGSAVVIRTRIPVWSLVAYKNLGLSDETLLQNYPTLRQQDLVNAWNYYLANPEEIDLKIRENDEV